MEHAYQALIILTKSKNSIILGLAARNEKGKIPVEWSDWLINEFSIFHHS